MKERYNVEVADIALAILSDDGEDFVRQIATTIDTRVRELTSSTKYLSTVEAVILLALDYCGEKHKADRKIKSLETQVEILEANLRRLREEAASAHPAPATESTPATDPAPAAESAPATDPAPAADSAPAEESAPAADPESRGNKLRAIEALLGSQLRLDADGNE